MTGPGIKVEDATIAAVVVAMVDAGTITQTQKQGVADFLATLNRRHVAAVHPMLDAGGRPHYPDAIIEHGWPWRPLSSPVEVLTRLDFLRSNIEAAEPPVPEALWLDLHVTREATIRRLDGYGRPEWSR